jgi:predicted ATP-dependent endonuclease of OLD family
VILIDEPGLYLHATAQQDVLDVLEKSIAQEAQVVFSTHSPYLIDPDRFDRLRLIIKDQDSGTVIQGKVHAGADRETMTPIVTAIGLSISHEFSVAGRKNVLVEGITDYFYLQAMRRLVPGNLLDGITFIPCVGAPKVPQIASLLIGWGLGFVALLDRDAAGKRAAKILKQQLLLPKDRVIYPGTQEGTAIEDLFTTGDFGKYVLRRPSAKDVSNSKAAKSEALDGALLARQFFQRAVGEPERLALRATTIAKFEKLFMVITAGLESEA